MRLDAGREILTTLSEVHTTPDQLLVDPRQTGVDGPEPVHAQPVVVVNFTSVLNVMGVFGSFGRVDAVAINETLLELAILRA